MDIGATGKLLREYRVPEIILKGQVGSAKRRLRHPMYTCLTFRHETPTRNDSCSTPTRTN